MTQIVRREVKNQPGWRHPMEIAWTSDGTWIIEDLHLGAWTDRVVEIDDPSAPEETTGNRISKDQLNFNILHIALTRGLVFSPQDFATMEKCRQTLEPPSSVGRAKIADPSLAEQLQQFADRGLAWLNENVAPEGRNFVVEDALYLIES
jgi:hypothetical protein